MTDTEIWSEALSAIECAELGWLSWGAVDASLSEADAEDTIQHRLDDIGVERNAADVLDELAEAALIRYWREYGERRYRSRFGELVRLLVRSRQMFPGRPWENAPTLVSDYRVLWRRRKFPKRQFSYVASLEYLEAADVFLEDIQKELWSALIDDQRSPIRLARFQLDAAIRILSASKENGTVVTAGTGSGKTLAFYLPVILQVALSLKGPGEWVKTLCLYPRQELLKDQLSEAYRLGVSANLCLVSKKRRALSFGSLFGATPNSAKEQELKQKGWKPTGNGYICPYLRCPLCEREMVWKTVDLKKSVERLSCSNGSCPAIADSRTFLLTRESIRRKPPDFLFTTTEMLNQRMSDTGLRHIFGIGLAQSRRPKYVLLDEIHTYAGTSGAQTALTLRRWRHLVNSPVAWVGLSATLQEATRFFSDLTGVADDSLTEVTPESADLEEKGAEYQLLLRSDPTSQAATLSTSIQSLMLLARMLDDPGNTISNGLFGSRVFAFTDDLDVTHRLFDDLRDAEAYARFGGRDPGREPLAALRSTTQPDPDAREKLGQRWRMAEDLRESLSNELRVERTTSRDPGVASRADVIVATAALEVGFNDISVGAVLQHKAPRSSAAFIQRRGRAGRTRDMRPISVTIVSDFGRDRLAFQAYEQLFSPIVERASLPIRNTYILRIQAVYAFFDWMASKLAQQNCSGWCWASLSQPKSAFDDERFRDGAKQLLKRLVEIDGDLVRDLSEHLGGALQIEDGLVEQILWERPRPLLLEVVPTLVRRLFLDWKLAHERDRHDLYTAFHPLPDFMPRNLFHDLNLPEVEIEVPAATVNDSPTSEFEQIEFALRQFAPGRVSRRYADKYRGLSHWIPIPQTENGNEMLIAIDEIAPDKEVVSDFQEEHDRNVSKIYRPWTMKIQRTPHGIGDASNAAWDWRSAFSPRGEALLVDPESQHNWNILADEVKFYLHRFGASLSIVRYTRSGTANVVRNGNRETCRFRIVDEEKRSAALGFAFEADALCIPVREADVPVRFAQEIPAELDRWLTYLRYTEAVDNSTLIPHTINTFQRAWCHEVFLDAAIRRASGNGMALSLAALDLLGNEGDEIEAAVSTLSTRQSSREEEVQKKLEENITELLRDDGIRSTLANCLATALDHGSDSWRNWLKKLLGDTFAEGVLEACFIAAPKNSSANSLTVDQFSCAGQNTVVVAETTLGGGGTIEAIAGEFSADPAKFFRALDAAFTPSDLELAEVSFRRLIALLSSEADVQEALANLRLARDRTALEKAHAEFESAVRTFGIQISPTFSNLIGSRLLRPGTSLESDTLTSDLHQYWEELEMRNRIAIPSRMAAGLLAAGDGFSQRLRELPYSQSAVFAANLLISPRPGEIRRNAFNSFNPFRRSCTVDTALVRHFIDDGKQKLIRIDSSDWRTEFTEAILANKSVLLGGSAGQEKELRQIAIEMIDTPVYAEYLRFFPTVEGFRLSEEGEPIFEFTLN